MIVAFVATLADIAVRDIANAFPTMLIPCPLLIDAAQNNEALEDSGIAGLEDQVQCIRF